jgi:hypothetical protein
MAYQSGAGEATFCQKGIPMCAQQHISRRQVLHRALAAGSLAIVGHGHRVGAQTGTRIEQLAPELEQIISPSEPIQMVAEGFGGTLGPAEGPLWWKEGGYLLFSDIHNNKRMKLVFRTLH